MPKRRQSRAHCQRDGKAGQIAKETAKQGRLPKRRQSRADCQRDGKAGQIAKETAKQGRLPKRRQSRADCQRDGKAGQIAKETAKQGRLPKRRRGVNEGFSRGNDVISISIRNQSLERNTHKQENGNTLARSPVASKNLFGRRKLLNPAPVMPTTVLPTTEIIFQRPNFQQSLRVSKVLVRTAFRSKKFVCSPPPLPPPPPSSLHPLIHAPFIFFFLFSS